MKRIIQLLILITVLATSCKKENQYQDAVIRGTGDPIADGCGWLVETPTATYKPINLPAEFEVNQLEVKIKYDLLNSFYACGYALHISYEEICISKIKEQ